MSIYIKNNTVGDKTWVGQLVNSGSYYLVQSHEEQTWANNSLLLTDIGSGDAIVAKDDSGNKDISDVAQAINYLKGNPHTLDTDGSQIIRPKAAPAGWHYQAHSIEMTTATTDGFYNKDKDGNDLGFVTYTMYDVGDAVTTVEANCVKTVVTWEATHDFEIIGGELLQNATPANDIRLWVTGLPGIANVSFMQGGFNLKHLANKMIQTDGRVSKHLKYADPIPGTNKFEMLFKHNAGDQHTIHMIMEIFKA